MYDSNTCRCGKPLDECSRRGIVPDDQLVASSDAFAASGYSNGPFDDGYYSPPMKPLGRTTGELLRDGWTMYDDGFSELRSQLATATSVLIELKDEVRRRKATDSADELAQLKLMFGEIAPAMEDMQDSLTNDEWDATLSQFREITSIIDEIEDLLADVSTLSTGFAMIAITSFDGGSDFSPHELKAVKAQAAATYRSKTGYADEDGTTLQVTADVIYYSYGGGQVLLMVQMVEVPWGYWSYPLPKPYAELLDANYTGGPLLKRFLAGKEAERRKAMVAQVLGEVFEDFMRLENDPDALSLGNVMAMALGSGDPAAHPTSLELLL